MKFEGNERARLISRIQSFFLDERGEEIGELAAGNVLDFIEAQVAPSMYNQGVRDAHALVQRFQGSLNEELEFLEIRKP